MSQFDSQGYDGGTFSTTTTPYSDGDTLNGGNFTDYSSGDIADGGTFTESRNYHNVYTQKDLNVATDDVVITGVKVILTSKEDKTKDVNALAGKEGYVVSISDNPFISADKAQTVANYIFKKIGGMRFRPLDATLLSNPFKWILRKDRFKWRFRTDRFKWIFRKDRFKWILRKDRFKWRFRKDRFKWRLRKDNIQCVYEDNKPCNSSCRYSNTCIHSASKTEE